METPLKKKGAWRAQEIMSCIDAYIENFNTYKCMKKNGQVKGFHDSMCELLVLPKGCTENLMKNLGREFREEIKGTMVSGAATTVPKLRGSPDLYLKYEEYQQLYFPAGGQVKPQAVVTEGEVKTFKSASARGASDAENGSPPKKRRQRASEDDLLEIMNKLVECNQKIAIELQTIRMILATQYGIEVRENEV